MKPHAVQCAALMVLLVSLTACTRKDRMMSLPCRARSRSTAKSFPARAFPFNRCKIDDKKITPGPGSGARCDAEGRYKLVTINDEAGAVVATHKVKIFAKNPDDPTSVESFPPEFNYQTTLTFEVPAGGTTEANFELTTKPAE